MKKKLSVIAVSLLAALPLSAYAAGCGHNTAEDFSVCVNSSCFSKIVNEEKPYVSPGKAAYEARKLEKQKKKSKNKKKNKSK